MSTIILLADPVLEWLKEASNFLRNHFYEVVTANNGRDAQLALYNNKLSAVVLNLALQDHAGFQVYKYIRYNYPSLQLILTVEDEISLSMVGLSKELLERQKMVEVMYAPIDLNQILNSLKGVQGYTKLNFMAPERDGQSPEETVMVGDDKFTSIKIGEFISSKAVQFDIYVRLSKDKYVKILKTGDSFSQDRIDKYKQKNVEHLYFLNEDRKKYLSFGNFLAEKIAAKPTISTNTKIKVLKTVGEKFLEEIYTEGLRPQVLDHGKNFCHNMYETIHKNEDLHTLLRNFQDFDATAYSHTYLVCLFVGMISKQFAWEEDTSAEILGMAALFHDVGFLNLPPELREKRPKDMLPQELKYYKAHPVLGAKILSENTKVAEVVKQIVLQHHECMDGSGFPHGLRNNKILIFSRILSLCDEFVHFMVDQKANPPQALKLFLKDTNNAKKFGTVLLENLIKVFIDPVKLPTDK